MEQTTTHTARGEAPCIISISGLTKAFGPLVAVDNLRLQVMRGDVFGFLGPNGAGKTTTIRMLLGLIRPSAGSIRIFGMENRAHLGEILPRIGAIIETPIFYPYLSGIDNLRVIAASSGMQMGSACERRIQEVLDLVDLARQAKDAYHKYSLGMKQRLAIGATLLSDPELILLDEPTNGLDPVGVHEIRQLILRLASLGKTIFLSSHILYEVQQVCNRVAILQRGHLVRQGRVAELLNADGQVMLRLSTPEETRKALQILQHAGTLGATWIESAAIESDRQNRPIIRVTAPATRSHEITALLADNNLFIAEIYPYQVSLEEIFLELTAQEDTAHPGMVALASADTGKGDIQ